jgi:ATP-dependent DNA helicase RecG
MSATPIPRTLALMMYGELELSIIKELPKGRQPIETFAVTGKLRNRAFNFIAKEINNKHQCYIICPLVEDSEKMDDKKSVLSYTEKLKSIFPEFSINYLHGRMSAQDKDKVMAQFKDGNIDILVSTTVVEVGVDVPNATVMMIEDAERFGMSQLHQLRGRVGRGNCKSYCILVTDNATEDAKKRLKTLSSTNDGFKIAEEDLAQRGAGDFFGNRQHGLPPLKIADLSKDLNLFQMTREAAENIIKADPELLNTENRALRLEVMRLFAKSGQNDLN